MKNLRKTLKKLNKLTEKEDGEKVEKLIESIERKFGTAVNEIDEGKLDDQSRELLEQAEDFIEADRMASDTRQLLRDAIREKLFPGNEYGPYIVDFSSTQVIYQISGSEDFYQVDYKINAKNVVTLGNPIEVEQKTIYEPVMESKREQLELELKESGTCFEGRVIPLIESNVDVSGVIPIKIIEPGWGSSGYYPATVLKRDAGIYKEGLHMYWDHPTITEERERPERSLNDLAGVLVSDGKYKEDGHAGPGVYASAKLFNGYADKISEMKDYIGLSHIAWGGSKFGEAEGRSGKIIESLKVAESVDFVTRDGAGGKIVELFESKRNPISKNKESKMNEEEVTKLKEAQAKLEADNKRLKESIVLNKAKDFVASKLADEKYAKIPGITKTRLQETLSKDPIANDQGELDTEKFGEAVDKAIKAEIDYISAFSESGKITNLGGNPGEQTEETELTKYTESLEKTFIDLGYSKEDAKAAAIGRV